MANVKAIIGLTRGRVAYFEPKSNIMLGLANPLAHVYEGTDVSELRKALGGSIYLVSGSLVDEPVVEEAKAEPIIEEVKAEPAAEVISEVKEEQPAKAEVAEEKIEEPVKKVSRKKK